MAVGAGAVGKWAVGKAPVASGGGSASIAPNLLTNTSTVYNPAVSMGAVSIAPALLNNSNTVFQPAIVTGFTILADLVENTSTLFSPAVSGGTLVISPDLLGSSGTIYPPAVQTAGSFTQAQLDEILAYVEANLMPWDDTMEGTLTFRDGMRIMLAALAGKRQGLGTATEEYLAQDGVTPRITFTPSDAAGNGTTVVDGT